MLGAVIGDIVGSRFEWNNNRSKKFDFLTGECFPTDDSIMTLAIAKAILESRPDYSDLGKKAVFFMQHIGRNYPYCGYGRILRLDLLRQTETLQQFRKRLCNACKRRGFFRNKP